MAEAYPSTATINALNGTTDPSTGLEYIPIGTKSTSNPSLAIRMNRRLHRQNLVLALANAGRVFKEGDNLIGAYALYFRIADVDCYFEGATGVAISTSNGYYPVYVLSDGNGAGVLTVGSTGAAFPEDTSTYIPLAYVYVQGGVIVMIEDYRNLLVYSAPISAAAASTGIDGTSLS